MKKVRHIITHSEYSEYVQEYKNPMYNVRTHYSIFADGQYIGLVTRFDAQRFLATSKYVPEHIAPFNSFKKAKKYVVQCFVKI